MRLPALEKNILVFRALQMALFLFYAESIRRQLMASVGRRGKTAKGGKFIKSIFEELEAKSLLTRGESAELQDLLEHRNKIAHEIHLLTGDIEIPGRRYGFSRFMKIEYDYQALEKIKKWNEQIDRRLSQDYILTLSLDSVFFEAAEHAYERELAALQKRIDRQYVARLRVAKSRTSR